MKKILILILLFLLLVGGGLGVMTALGKGPFAELLAKRAAEQKEEAAKKAAEEAAKPAPTVFFDLGTYIIPIIDHRQIVKQVGLDMEIEVLAKDQAKVADQMPLLQNAVNLDLYDFLPQHADVRNPADKEAVRQHLIQLGNKMFGANVVHDIVIKSMYYR